MNRHVCQLVVVGVRIPTHLHGWLLGLAFGSYMDGWNGWPGFRHIWACRMS
jgi:hypothetical protein